MLTPGHTALRTIFLNAFEKRSATAGGVKNCKGSPFSASSETFPRVFNTSGMHASGASTLSRATWAQKRACTVEECSLSAFVMKESKHEIWFRMHCFGHNATVATI